VHLLLREISPYNDADCVLGVFMTEAEAIEARRTHLQRIENVDPWAKQAYRSPSPEDVKVIGSLRVVDLGTEPRRVYVVSEYAEGFGQILRRFVAICGAEPAARLVAAEVEATFEKESFPRYCKIDEVQVGTLLTNDVRPMRGADG
jgi:hypothetical protein